MYIIPNWNNRAIYSVGIEVFIALGGEVLVGLVQVTQEQEQLFLVTFQYEMT